MSTSWQGRKEPTTGELLLVNWVFVFLRGFPVAFVVFGGLILHFFLRFFEVLFLASQRSATQYLTQVICRTSLFLLGISLKVRGAPMIERGAVVANHSSWLDIFALNATQKIYFVAKSEVANWPGRAGWPGQLVQYLFKEKQFRHANKKLYSLRGYKWGINYYFSQRALPRTVYVYFHSNPVYLQLFLR